ncbi:MAG: hypothetical protein IIU90_03385, partial [Bacteroidaceae bacterium]|nr:hypothetical protein [Bacteroidaceae bacterium]
THRPTKVGRCSLLHIGFHSGDEDIAGHHAVFCSEGGEIVGIEDLCAGRELKTFSCLCHLIAKIEKNQL